MMNLVLFKLHYLLHENRKNNKILVVKRKTSIEKNIFSFTNLHYTELIYFA